VSRVEWLVAAALLTAAIASWSRPATAQTNSTVIISVQSGKLPVPDAEVRANGQRVRTDANGEAALQLPPGTHEVAVSSPQHLPASVTAEITAGGSTRISVDLEPLPAIEEEVLVTATRSTTRLKDQPLRVEIIDAEEIEEKALMTPGSVAMLLGETSGLRVQTTAPSLGAANVRIQGLRGRYAQLIADGLPLYGAQGDSFSLLQVPPLDLGQVEVIKGVASALYGASALGGVINLVSRRPIEPQRELLTNRTSQEGTDVTGWLAQPTAGNWSWTLLGGYHGAERQDLDRDGWADLPAFDRGVVRPRVFFDDGRGRTVFVTAGAMIEDRGGGTGPGFAAPDGQPFTETLSTRHADTGVMARWLTDSGRVAAMRGSFMRQSRARRFGDALEHGVRMTYFGEVSLQGVRGRHTWVAGAAFQQDRFNLRELPRFDYIFSTPSIFLQDEIAFTPRVTMAASARADVHSEYGVLATPRLSLLLRPDAAWTIRLSAGTGAFSPTPFTEEADETGLSRVLPLRDLRAERALGTSFDVTRTIGPIEVTGTLFGSVVRDPLQRRIVGPTLGSGAAPELKFGPTTDAAVELVNAPEPTRTWGTELVTRYRAEGFMLLATHGWTRSTEIDPDAGIRREVPLTPRHAGSLNAIWEGEAWGRFGIEIYYTGRQMLENNAYRQTGSPYWLVGLLGERRWGAARFFVNAENIFDVRQTKDDPLILPSRLPDGRWTVDAWAPLDGRVVNGGVRLTF
jgi:outer membrane receptor for ferrienterochelin and colicins